MLAEIGILFRYRHAFSLKAISRVIIAAVLGIPLGVYALGSVDEMLVTAALGVILIFYGLEVGFLNSNVYSADL